MGEQELLVEDSGNVRLLTLNRPRALNALTPGMIRDLAHTLRESVTHPTIGAVVLRSASDRAFCAGGDVVSLYHMLGTEAGREQARAFYGTEYAMNTLVGSFTKPYIVLMDRLVLGGGMGISIHGNRRIVTERSQLGMPEVTIGFVPDVGALFQYSRMPRTVGRYLLLTGVTVGAADALQLGLADFFVPSERLAELTQALQEWNSTGFAASDARSIDALLAGFVQDVPEQDSPLRTHAALINEAFSAPSVSQILQRLETHAETNTFAAQTRELLLQKSPTSLLLTYEALERAAAMAHLSQVTTQDYRMASHFVDAPVPDLAEGIRAQLIDKDRKPAWLPPHVDEVDPAYITRFFEPPAHGDVDLHWQ